MKLANACTGTYILRLHCCASINEAGDACNALEEFNGDGHRDASDLAKAGGWSIWPGAQSAWCKAHAKREWIERERDVHERGHIAQYANANGEK